MLSKASFLLIKYTNVVKSHQNFTSASTTADTFMSTSSAVQKNDIEIVSCTKCVKIKLTYLSVKISYTF